MPLNAEAPPPHAERPNVSTPRRIMIVPAKRRATFMAAMAREIAARNPGCELFGIAGEKIARRACERW